ncbi:hypothetical protein O181_091206 [Austropuccinia psidii MF-1]|uniref:Uncharacterized protein n=1 Tax=Austropuccinia psidii MF-1 TaxID=1389203 RepID=A0A9Q3IX23_9BASI|nr:hypothetical protein [Austropuccinia psidii MF-1]
MHVSFANLSLAAAVLPPVPPVPPSGALLQPSSVQQVLALGAPSRQGPTRTYTFDSYPPPPTQPPAPHGALSLVKRQVVVAIEVVTVVVVVPQVPVPNPSPVTVTVTVPPPTKTQITDGGWPIINPGSASACWSDYACNSVCPNFQQNGWYAHCIDPGCSLCRCQIIASSMCTGPPWRNATVSSNAPAKTIQIGPAVATVAVAVNQAAPSTSIFYNQLNPRTRFLSLTGLICGLTYWMLV